MWWRLTSGRQQFIVLSGQPRSARSSPRYKEGSMFQTVIRLALGAALMVPAMSSVAEAGPLACAKAIAGCGKGVGKSGKQIKATRAACAALRDCKKVCRVDKRETKHDNKDDKKVCVSRCDKKKKGKAKRACKQSCRQDKRGDNQDARQDKQACVTQCRADYKTPACKKARADLVKTLTVEGLKCSAAVAVACPTAVP